MDQKLLHILSNSLVLPIISNTQKFEKENGKLKFHLVSIFIYLLSKIHTKKTDTYTMGKSNKNFKY